MGLVKKTAKNVFISILCLNVDGLSLKNGENVFILLLGPCFHPPEWAGCPQKVSENSAWSSDWPSGIGRVCHGGLSHICWRISTCGEHLKIMFKNRKKHQRLWGWVPNISPNSFHADSYDIFHNLSKIKNWSASCFALSTMALTSASEPSFKHTLRKWTDRLACVLRQRGQSK